MTVSILLSLTTSQVSPFELLLFTLKVQLDPLDLMHLVGDDAFGQKSSDLCAALVAVALRMSTTFIDPSTLLAYTSCHLIPLDKCAKIRTKNL